MEGLLSESVTGWGLRYISFSILIIVFLFYTTIEKVLETFVSLSFILGE